MSYIDATGVLHVSEAEAADPNFDPSTPFFKIDSGEPTVATDDSLEGLAKRVAALEARDGLLTQADERIIEGKYQGAQGAAADVVALKGGVDDVSGKVLPDPK